ncbi:MAG: hypothetical protein KY396_01795 [Actinobacteria bacterium]|nr:hypothetical protein [Actinomycetota bacterium]
MDFAALAFEIAFALGFATVLVSFAGVVLERVGERFLLVVGGALAVGAAVSAAALGINLAERFTDTAPLVLATAGLASAAVAELGLAALVRGFRRLRDHDQAADAGRARIAAALDADAAERADELERRLARERANASHMLGEQERRLALERRDSVVRQSEQARGELTEAVARAQERLERRLTAWAADLDRGQRALETRLTELGQRQSAAIDAYEARLAADSEHLRTATDEQQAALTRLRAELQGIAANLIAEGRSEMEAHAAERQHHLQELTRKMRERERELGEQIAREEVEARARLAAGFAEAERRQLANLERVLERAASRLGEEAERRFDAQIRQSREKSAERLSHELDKAMEQFARRAEKEISDRIADVAQSTAVRLERRIVEIAHAAESQHEVSADRLRHITQRLDEALERAEKRISAFEAEIESEVSARLEELERSMRAATS